MSVDAVTFNTGSPSPNHYNVMVEAKSTTNPGKNAIGLINYALVRQDTNAKVSFIVIDKSPPNYTKIVKEIVALNRSEKEEGKWAKVALPEARLLLVDVDYKLARVLLESLDGKDGTPGDQVIFIICLDKINRAFSEWRT